MGAHIGGVFKPVQPLGVEIVDAFKASACQEVVFDVIGGSFDLAFGARPVRPVCLGHEAVVVGEVQEGLVPLAGADPDLLHVVVEDGLRPAAEEPERLQVTVDELLHPHRGREADEQHTRERQDHQEHVDRDE